VPLPTVLGAVIVQEGTQAARVPAEVAPVAIDQLSQLGPDPELAISPLHRGPSRDIGDYSQTSRTR